MSTPKMFGSIIVSKSKVKSLMEIAQELEAKDLAEQNMTKSASVAPKKEVVASAKVVTEKAVETKAKATVPAKTPIKAEATTKKIAKETIKIEASNEVLDEVAPVKEASKSPRFTKIAKLTDKDKSYLKKYYEAYYPADYVDALLADF